MSAEDGALGEPERKVAKLYRAGLIGKTDAARILAAHYDEGDKE
jgi:hypothetical protein